MLQSLSFIAWGAPLGREAEVATAEASELNTMLKPFSFGVLAAESCGSSAL